MTQIFTETGNLVAVTLVEVGPCKVLEEKKYLTKEAVVIGFEEVLKENKKNKPLAGHFKRLGQPYFRYVKETTRLTPEPFDKNVNIGVDIFSEDEKIDLTTVSIGRGFQGGMKRHNWSGQPKSHGSTTHRRIGSAGASAYPSKIVKGHPMPGHMGNAKVTVRNLKVLKVDKEKGLLYILGSCPGPKNSLVVIRKKKI